MLLIPPFCFAWLLGFILPGYLLSGLLSAGNRWLWSFPLSLVLLFWSVFFAGICGWPITPAIVSTILLAPILLFLALRRLIQLSPPAIPSNPPPAHAERTLARRVFLALGVLTLIVLFRATRWPLGGNDNAFRWDFLARGILRLHSFNFYPPVSAADYRVYFYTDGIPPLLSFSYWWMYACTGGWHPALTGIFVAAQLAAILWFTFSVGRKLDSLAAGAFAAAILGGSTLFVYSLAMAQETGLIALSVAATLDAVISRQDRRAMVLAGFAAALGALSREYGWIIPVLGALAVLWRRGGWSNALILVGTAAILALPWYLRNAIRTGNPLYSNRLLGFHVNALHVAMLDYYRGQLGIAHWDSARWTTVALNLLCEAPLQWTMGVAAALILFRKLGFLGVAAAVFFALFLDSIGYTSGNWAYAIRVLPPTLVALSIPAGVWMARIRSPLIWRILAAAALAWSILAATIYPYFPTTDAFQQWSSLALSTGPHTHRWWTDLPRMLPRGSRLLCDNAYIHAGLVGSGIECIPVWGPQVAFLNDPRLSLDDMRRRLLQLGIRYVVVGYDLNGLFLASHLRFYRLDMRYWKVIATANQTTFLCRIPAPNDRTPGRLMIGPPASVQGQAP
ncbi:MAG TPA: hypothetical protein VL992_11630 [Tepidisphaeraceae bacterium]|nr:hypothetical protein [Tepidisphaeraceae bacterium]